MSGAESRSVQLAPATRHHAGPPSRKYKAIAAFVDAHATPLLLTEQALGSAAAVVPAVSGGPAPAAPAAWHASYDEEAEEDVGGEYSAHEPELLAFAAAAAAAGASASASSAVAPGAIMATSHHRACSADTAQPKPWCMSWDEEAEGAFELADRPMTAAVVDARAQRRAALHEARHAARMARRARRAALHPQLGDLEHMQAWVGDAAAAAAAARGPLARRRSGMPSSSSSSPGALAQYQAQLLCLVAGAEPAQPAPGSAVGQFRRPKAWHLTFDEDVHGCEGVPDAVLGSC